MPILHAKFSLLGATKKIIMLLLNDCHSYGVYCVTINVCVRAFVRLSLLLFSNMNLCAYTNSLHKLHMARYQVLLNYLAYLLTYLLKKKNINRPSL